MRIVNEILQRNQNGNEYEHIACVCVIERDKSTNTYLYIETINSKSFYSWNFTKKVFLRPLQKATPAIFQKTNILFIRF